MRIAGPFCARVQFPLADFFYFSWAKKMYFHSEFRKKKGIFRISAQHQSGVLLSTNPGVLSTNFRALRHNRCNGLISKNRRDFCLKPASGHGEKSDILSRGGNWKNFFFQFASTASAVDRRSSVEKKWKITTAIFAVVGWWSAYAGCSSNGKLWNWIQFWSEELDRFIDRK